MTSPWQSPAEAAAWRLRRVLVVDDVEGMRMVSEALLQQLGIRQVLLADSAEAALALLQRQGADLVLCDWRMPGMDGLQLRQRLLALPPLRDLPFLLMSADADPHHLDTAQQAGAHGLLVKPFGAPALAAALRQAVAQARGQGGRAATEGALPSLLLVCDEAAAPQLGLVEALQGQARVRVAGSAERALAISQAEEAADLVLLAAGPALSAPLLPRLLRAGQAVLLLDDDAERRRLALEAGVLEACPLPTDPEAMAGWLRRLRALLRWLPVHRSGPPASGAADWETLASHDPSTPLGAALSELEQLQPEQDEGAEAERLRSIEQSLLEGLAEWQLSTGLALIAVQRYPFKARAVPWRKLAERALRLVLAENLHRALQGDCRVPGALRGPQALQANGDPLLTQTVLWLLLRLLAGAAPKGGALRIELQAQGDLGWRLWLQAAGATLPDAPPGLDALRSLLQVQRGRLLVERRGDAACLGIELPRALALSA